MVTQNKSFVVEISNATNYVLSWDNSLVLVDNPTGTITQTGQIDFEFQYPDAVNIEETEFTLTLTSSCATKIITFTLSNICNALVDVQHTPGDYYYTYTATPGYTYKWGKYSEFDIISKVDNVLVLSPKSFYPNSFELKVLIIGENGCRYVRSVRTNLCVPQAGYHKKDVYQNNEGVYTITFQLNVEGCGYDFDWKTVSLDPDVNFSVDADGFITITFNEAGTTTYEWRVTDTRGITSNAGTIILTGIGAVQQGDFENMPDITVALNEGQTGNITIPIPSTTTLSELSFIPATGQTLVSSTQLNTTNGTATITGPNTVRYTIGVQNENVDLIQVQGLKIDDSLTNVGKIYVDYEAIPNAVVSPQAITVQSGDTKVLTITDYWNDPIEANAIIKTVPQFGNVTISNGKINYFTNGTSDDTFTISMPNSSGVYADITFDITTQSAGNNATLTKCLDTAFSLNSALSGAQEGGVWSVDPANPEVVDISNPSSVQISTHGTYKFYYTVGSDVATITVISQTSSVLITQAPRVVARDGSYFGTITYQTTGVSSNSSFVRVTKNGIADFPGTIINGIANVELEFEGTGSHTVSVRAIDKCGNTISQDISVTV